MPFASICTMHCLCKLPKQPSHGLHSGRSGDSGRSPARVSVPPHVYGLLCSLPYLQSLSKLLPGQLHQGWQDWSHLLQLLSSTAKSSSSFCASHSAHASYPQDATCQGLHHPCLHTAVQTVPSFVTCTGACGHPFP